MTFRAELICHYFHQWSRDVTLEQLNKRLRYSAIEPEGKLVEICAHVHQRQDTSIFLKNLLPSIKSPVLCQDCTWGIFFVIAVPSKAIFHRQCGSIPKRIQRTQHGLN